MSLDLSTPVEDLISNPPSGFAWSNADALLGASISGEQLYASHKLNSAGRYSKLAGSRCNAPRLEKTIDAPAVDVLARLVFPPNDEQRAAFVSLVCANESRRNARVAVENGRVIFGAEESLPDGVAIPAANLGATGLWLRITAFADRVMGSYSSESTTTPPTTTWKRLGAANVALGPVLLAGIGVSRQEPPTTFGRESIESEALRLTYLDVRAAF